MVQEVGLFCQLKNAEVNREEIRLAGRAWPRVNGELERGLEALSFIVFLVFSVTSVWPPEPSCFVGFTKIAGLNNRSI